MPDIRCDENDVERRDANVATADDAGREVFLLGHTPFVLHKMTWRWEEDLRLDYEDFLRIDFEWLSLCDAILYLGPSPGADVELAEAERLGLIVYRSADEIPRAA